MVYLAYILAAILVADVVVWLATRNLLFHRNHETSAFMDSLMEGLGSWGMFWTAAAVTVACAAYVIFGHRQEGPLDLGISIATALFDIIVLIGVNYSRRIDHQLLTDIHAKVFERERRECGDGNPRSP